MAKKGRPKGGRDCSLNLSITAQHKEYLMRQCFERSTGDHKTTYADIIAELIDNAIAPDNKEKRFYVIDPKDNDTAMLAILQIIQRLAINMGLWEEENDGK